MVLSIKEPAGKKAKGSNIQLVLQGFEKQSLDCGHVIFAPTHLEGNVELAELAGLEIDSKCGGVMVNAEMLARSDIYVAGDTASYPDRNLGRRRMQSYDHSFHSGALAAMNMVPLPPPTPPARFLGHMYDEEENESERDNEPPIGWTLHPRLPPPHRCGRVRGARGRCATGGKSTSTSRSSRRRAVAPLSPSWPSLAAAAALSEPCL